MTTIDQIDFSALQQIKSIGPYVIFGTLRNRLILLTVIALGIGSIVASRQAIIVMFIGIGYVIWLSRLILSVKARVWRQFALSNNWPIHPADMTLLPPAVSNIGHSKVMSEIVTAQFNNVTCNLFSYKYVVGYGKYATTYNLTVGRAQLAKVLPHIILDGNKNDENFIRNTPNLEHLKLEGDFDKYFSLYLTKGEEIDVLSIITPDVMQVLIDSEEKQDIEIAGSSLYFATAYEAREPIPLRSLFQSITVLYDQINHRVNTLNYTPPSLKQS